MLYKLFLFLYPMLMLFIFANSRKKIKYNISEFAWIKVDFCVYWFSLLCMLACISILHSLEKYRPDSEFGIFMCILLEQGGAVLIVILLGGFLSLLLIRSVDLDYIYSDFICHCKMNFTIVALSCAVLCYLVEDNKSISNNNFLLLQSIMWGMVAIQLWLGFDTFSRPRKFIKAEENVKRKKITIKTACIHIFALLLGPISFTIYYYYVITKKTNIPVIKISEMIFFIIESFIIVVFELLIYFYRCPLNIEKDKNRLKENINMVKSGMVEIKKFYYRNTKIIISKKNNENKIEVKIPFDDLEYDKKDENLNNSLANVIVKNKIDFDCDNIDVAEIEGWIEDFIESRRKTINECKEYVKKNYILLNKH